jgi:hypothetical protein
VSGLLDLPQSLPCHIGPEASREQLDRAAVRGDGVITAAGAEALVGVVDQDQSGAVAELPGRRDRSRD